MSGRTYTPQATIGDVNDVLGRERKPIAGAQGAIIHGVNPQKLTCDGISIRQTLSLSGIVDTQFTHIGGSLVNPAIRFTTGPATGCGIYSPAANDIRVAIGGGDAVVFSTAGFGTSQIFSPTGIIDFSGSTLIGIGSITTNPRSYDVVGTPVTTAGAVATNILTIPIAPVVAHAGTWEIQPKVIYVINATGGATSGTYTFRVRVSLAIPGDIPTVSAQYDITQYEDPALLGATVAITAVAGAIRVMATGLAVTSIEWQAMARIVTVESTP